MRSVILVLVSLLCSSPVLAQGTDVKLPSELETLHAKWFKAYDSGDGATMDQMEMDNLTLVMPTGEIWPKDTARAGIQPKRDPQAVRTLSNVSVRRFGDTAILTGVLTTKSAKENSRYGTTVVFVQSSGKWKIASAQWTPVASAN
jgi:ketosteroid isomerase-like protein